MLDCDMARFSSLRPRNPQGNILGGHMMTTRRARVTAVAGLIALALPIGWAWGDNVGIEVTPQPQPPPSSTTVIVPPPAPPATQYVLAPSQAAVPVTPQTIRSWSTGARRCSWSIRGPRALLMASG